MEKKLIHPTLEGAAHDDMDSMTWDGMEDNVFTIFLFPAIQVMTYFY